MIPSVISSQIRKGVEDFLRTTFPPSNPFFQGVMDRLIGRGQDLFKGPYLSLKLPFEPGDIGPDVFEQVPMDYRPHRHQEQAFRRLGGDGAKSTIISTGTGSGKTECFLYPILDHCYRHRGEPGIKAIIIYPMNALARDQAKRLAKTIFHNENLKNKVTAGLFIGGEGADQGQKGMQMTEDMVITNKDTMRLNPPDILMTNYKMLDYLLIRPNDYPLWQGNGAESLKYLVVDELHTFDGAQGTDLACLIRRLRERLKTPNGYLCCVGTSATLGGQDNRQELQQYAESIFGQPFEGEAVVTETLITPETFFGGKPLLWTGIVPPEKEQELTATRYTTARDYVSAQYTLWFGKEAGDVDRPEWRLALGEELKQHAFFRNLILVLNGKVLPMPRVVDELDKIIPDFVSAPPSYKGALLDSFMALVCCAKIKPQEQILPFLNVRYQLWLRELRRMVADVAPQPEIRFSDDLKADEVKVHMPVIHCRECGAMGWAGTKRQQDTRFNPDLQQFYSSFFGQSPNVHFVFPLDGVEKEGQQEFPRLLCGHCLHLTDGSRVTSCPACGKKDRLIPVLDVNDRVKDHRTDRVYGSHNCPFCQGYESLTILGSRAASLISVTLGQLYSSPFYNEDDKKLLAFSDSVQDASHRAGFFEARTYRFNFRTALQKFIQDSATDVRLDRAPAQFNAYWKSRMDGAEFITTFLAPNMAWLEDYEAFLAAGKIPEGSDLPENVEKRIDWEIASEYGFGSRIGRTLEKSGCSIAHVDESLLSSLLPALLDCLKNEVGGLGLLDQDALRRFLLGLLAQMRMKGAVDLPVLKSFIEDWGGYYKLGHGENVRFMPNFSKRARTPVFLTTKHGTRFDPLLGSGGRTSWYEQWLQKNLGTILPQVGQYAPAIYPLVLKALVGEHILKRYEVDGTPVWGIERKALLIGKAADQYRCSKCGGTASAPQGESQYWDGMPCMRYDCAGLYRRQPPAEDYYGALYSSGEVRRIFAAEHTGLLERAAREKLEQDFINQDRPAAPNLLSCTPTLEMGINIGDLSTVILCTVPPAAANYLQRIGRSGRRDGNAFNLTVAEGRPHDLYFYDEPEEMLAGAIEPPGVFLNAPAVLERQFTGFCFDRWVESGIKPGALPSSVGSVLANLEKKENKALFPFNFLRFIENNRTEFRQRFLDMFGAALSDPSRDYIRAFVEGSAEAEESLSYKITNRLHDLLKERENLKKKVQRVTKVIRETEASHAKDKDYEDVLDELRREKAALNAIILEINSKDTFNFFTDEGLLPNYTFPEAGVVLRSIIWRQRKRSKEGKERSYDTRVFTYERPAAAAIHELAPANHFYAEGRKVTVDQVNLELSEVENWRFCNSCPHSELVDVLDKDKTCPKCGSTAWADQGQKRRMLRMRQVVASTSDRASRSDDSSDEREPVFYNKTMLVDVDTKFVEKAYRIDKEDLPFGFEFVRKAVLREINFGRKDSGNDTVLIAGQTVSREGFVLCAKCGHVLLPGAKEFEHDATCPYRRKKDETPLTDYLYLYRDFKSEAIRMLLPVSSFGVTTKLHSFIAALYLGLRSKFKGRIDHLETTVMEEPLPDSSLRKRYLVLYDRVPGGTGYLKDLTKSEGDLMSILEAALEALRSCSCRNDPQKDGCYRCLYAFRLSHDMPDISRTVAMEMLAEILKYKDKLVRIDTVSKISINALFESELEARFMEALRRHAVDRLAGTLEKQVVRGKPGWYLKLGEAGYYIEPQVSLGEAEGVAVPSRADFLFHPERTQQGPPIAVFTDGFMFHADASTQHNRVGKDMVQRTAILQTGKYRVWSLSWDDVERQFTPSGQATFFNYTNHRIPNLMALLDAYDSACGVKRISRVHDQDGFEGFMTYLANPDPKMWACYAFALAVNLPERAYVPSDSGNEAVAELLGKSPWKEFALGKLANQADGAAYCSRLGASYPNARPQVVVCATAPRQAVQTSEYSEVKLIARLFDDDDAAVDPDFKSAWNGFLRLHNLMQFLPGGHFVTSRGLELEEYGRLQHQEGTSGAAPGGNDQTGALGALLSVTDRELHPFLRHLATHGTDLPEPGYELAGTQGEVIATAELAWPDKKKACLRPGEMEQASEFTKQGWTVKPLGDVLGDREAGATWVGAKPG